MGELGCVPQPLQTSKYRTKRDGGALYKLEKKRIYIQSYNEEAAAGFAWDNDCWIVNADGIEKYL